MAGGTFPTSLPTYTVTAGAETANGAAGGTGLSGLLNQFEVDVTALATKLGSGAATPAANKVLVGNGAGTSTWGSTLAGLTLTTPIITTLLDANGNTWFVVNAAAAAVNYIQVNTGASGTSPSIAAVGGGSNLNMDLQPKGTGIITNNGNDLETEGIYSNAIINSGAAVTQRTAPSLSTAYQYGAVDRFAAKATGTAVSAGTITQQTGSAAGTTGKAVHISGATITGTGIVYLRYRMEAKDAILFKNLAASFAAQVWQDTGGSLTYTVNINKPTVADNFAATTNIASTTQSIPTSTATRLLFQNINSGNLGDVSNGIEIEIQIACGAVTTKNFHFTEFVFCKGARAISYQPKPYLLEYNSSRRYYQKLIEPHFMGGTSGGTTSMSRFGGMWPTELRTAPTVTLGNLPLFDYGGTTNINAAGATSHYSTALCFEVDCQAAANFTAGVRPVVAYILGGGTFIVGDAEL